MNESTTQFEFTDDHNAAIGDLAKKMKVVGWVQVAFGALVFVATLFTIGDNGTSGLITGGIMVVIGRWTVTASKGFQKVVDTSGSDITHLMDGLGELHKLFGLEYWIFVIGIGLMVAIIGLSLVFGIISAVT